jgi:hypothetical protein
MQDNQIIQGFPCEKGWIHFKKDWRLLSFQLNKNFKYKNTQLPAHTWIHFPYNDEQSGFVCAFPFDYEIQGYICRGSGGFKGIQTGFYDSGKLRSFFPHEDITINGIPCRASLLSIVKLYENGNLKSCTLAEDYQAAGKKYKKGQVIELDIEG